MGRTAATPFEHCVRSMYSQCGAASRATLAVRKSARSVGEACGRQTTSACWLCGHLGVELRYTM